MSCGNSAVEGVYGRCVQRNGSRGWSCLLTPEGIRVDRSFKLGFKTLNNEAKYKALLARLRAALGLGATNIEIYLDSRLVVSQVDGSFEAKDPRMIDYLKLVKQTMNQFQTVILVQIS